MKEVSECLEISIQCFIFRDRLLEFLLYPLIAEY